MKPPPMIVIDNLSKTFPGLPLPVLREIKASFPPGKIIGIIGPDGAGKTTFLRLIAGLLKPSTGKITVEGLDTVSEGEKIHLITGYMAQKFGLYEDLSVWQNLSLYGALRGVHGEARGEKFNTLLTLTGLSQFKDRLVRYLSGGMKQKLAMACTLVVKPRLLLLDEPSVGVDPISRRELWKMVRLFLEEGISILWSTAYLDEAERCDHVLLLNEGKKVFEGNPKELALRMEGRVFKVGNLSGDHRRFLMEALHAPHPLFIDGVIQGDEVRLICRERQIPPFDKKKLNIPEGATLHPISPSFEDMFIDALVRKETPLSEGVHKSLPSLKKTEEGTAIEARALTKIFGSFTAVDQISFLVPKGKIFCILGPNGAGKSTTFKMLCGLERPTRGKSFVNGLDLHAASSEGRSHIGYMAQKFSLYGSLSVQQNLEFFSGIYNLKGREQRLAINQMIELFHLTPYLSISAEMLSLGFKQRLALACATIHQPSVLFLDEPTSGVDPKTRREFWNYINGLVERGVTVLATTHFIEEAEYCDEVALIYRGKIIQKGAPEALKGRARSPELPHPTLEDAFIKLIETYDLSRGAC